MLTIEQLDNIADVLYDMEDGKFNPSRYAEASLAVEVELGRRKHGPFTLAEAKASGMPFRRNCWAAWASEIIESPDGPEAITSDGSHVVWLRIDDITACDYELQEGGEE